MLNNNFSCALCGVLFFVLSLVLQHFWIKFQLREHFMQKQKSYGVNIDNEIKAATPSMGGVVFLVLALLALIINLYMGYGLNAVLFWILPIAGGVIGFIDDGLKFFTHTSEGFKSLGKLKVQLVICALWVIALYFNNNLGFWPGLDANNNLLIDLLIIILAFLASAGMLNAVNITDGLDGLAGGCFLISLAAAHLVIAMNDFNKLNIIILFFIAAGFMFFNIRPAKTFMGDTGAHFLGGAIASIAIMNGRLLALASIGFLFILEMLSSAIQIFTIRKLNRKVFLMAPLHHHFQLKFKSQGKNWDETRVTHCFWLAHAVGAVLIALMLMAL